MTAHIIDGFGSPKNWKLACVKWFGGRNNNTGRDNDFGFLETNINKDIFVHKNAVINKPLLVEGEIVLYEIGKDNRGKVNASNAYALSKNDNNLTEILYQYLVFSDEFVELRDYSIKKALADLFDCNDACRIVDKFSENSERIAEFISIIMACSNKNSLLTVYIEKIGLIKAISSGIRLSIIPSDLIAHHVNKFGFPESISQGIPISSMPDRLVLDYISTVGIIEAISHGVPVARIPRELIMEHVNNVGVIAAVSNGIPTSKIPDDLISEHVKSVGLVNALAQEIPLNRISIDIILDFVKCVGVISANANGIPLSMVPDDLIVECFIKDGVISDIAHGIPLSYLPRDLIAKHARDVGIDEVKLHGIPLTEIPKQVISDFVKSVGLEIAISHGVQPAEMSSQLIDDITRKKGIAYVVSNGVSPLLISKELIDNQIEAFTTFIVDMQVGKIKVNALLSEIINHISFSAALYLGFNQVVGSKEILDVWRNDMEGFVTKQFINEKINVANFVMGAYQRNITTYDQYRQHPLIKPFADAFYTKEKIFLKDFSFIDDIIKSPTLSIDPEFYVLANLIPIINQCNTPDSIITSILHDIWEALLTNKFRIDHPSFFNLFPRCQTLAEHFPYIDLSCEAFYWKTQTPEEIKGYQKRYPHSLSRIPNATNVEADTSIFLCRGKKCTGQHVIPNLNKHYLEFSLYDWLSHYGVKYELLNKPSQRDLPIKLAGYLNRIREIFHRLHCRCCGMLMKPNLSYALVEVTTFDIKSNSFITKPKSAAYRATVFYCANEGCVEHKINYYINHCIGFKCYEIIDSRDLKEKCSEGRYICTSCGSCCVYHKEKYGNVNNGESDSIKYKKIYNDSPFYFGGKGDVE
ncbi:cold shock domain-containing protein [Aeromonas sp. QDB62]|uniref:cold shock domain-containing protein n=1 Tax=Aeromonas sp. QDB62 TaxID=2990499 RepID=UPI0022E02311|nr:cold shock domain-containing protein [Aeromonas sp. QDB62]